jgi:hypothetical protein
MKERGRGPGAGGRALMYGLVAIAVFSALLPVY